MDACYIITHIIEGYFTDFDEAFDSPSTSEVIFKGTGKIGQCLATVKFIKIWSTSV